MSDNIEDLYLNGFMAFSEKNFKMAKAHWDQVLAQDPTHEKALRGMQELMALRKTRKRSSKEVLQQIKRLYGAKKYRESLTLCDRLLKKHPENEDLKGLRTKIYNRCLRQQNADGAAKSATAKPKADLESTMYYTQKAEVSVAQGDKDRAEAAASDVEKLIQEGVALYEVHDYQQAIRTWRDVLTLDPGNKIAREYIENVTPLLEEESPLDIEVDQAEAPTTSAGPLEEVVEPPESADLVENSRAAIHQEALAFFQQNKYREAIQKWHELLREKPDEVEALQGVAKAKNALAKEQKYRDILEKARGELAAGNHHEAERLLTQLSIEAPDLEGLDLLRTSIEDRQRQITEIRSLEIEEHDSHATSDFAATDDDITRYFTPEDEKKPAPRKVSKVVIPKKEKKVRSKFVTIGVPILLLGLGIGGYFGYDLYNKRLRTFANDAIPLTAVSDVDWKSHIQKMEDFISLGDDFALEGDYVLASLAFERVATIGDPRISELKQALTANAGAFEVKDELRRLERLNTKAGKELIRVNQEISPASVDERDRARAKDDINNGNLETASNRLFSVLSTMVEDRSLRNQLGGLQETLAFSRVKNEELNEALQFFKKATVLKPAYEMSRRHMEVIQRFYLGDIKNEELDQWFFFFVD